MALNINYQTINSIYFTNNKLKKQPRHTKQQAFIKLNISNKKPNNKQIVKHTIEECGK